MIIQNLLGRKSKSYFVSLYVYLVVGILCGKSLFVPLEKYTSDLELVVLDPVPLRIQYHGSIKLPDGKGKYVFLTQGRCIYAGVNESMPEQFVVKQVIAKDSSVIIQDKINGRMYALKKGEICYSPECFYGKFLNRQTGKCYNFSHTHRQITMEGKCLEISIIPNDFSTVIVNELKEDGIPFAYVLHKH